ncbi:single-stranded DNA-binding protein [Helicobacter sp. 13S00401-1]|uniref:single-stranded DNA-binding protein n=1 Tax=Helicobacter sp. 13S00401-1 TaxID=1905758 RepID=UPI000BA53645|nr:single-stranded DNA-binding protein [Helicobacter sp. 13S00401-1]PAF50949.1 single-stranded DNA-binding protein [Helicobacter sp. 13S00401-1]
MYNKVIIVGNLTRDVDFKHLPSGTALATIGLASNRRYKRSDGTTQDEVLYIDAKLFGRSAEVANEYLKKGSKVLIEGRLTLETWKDQNGSPRSKHTIAVETMQMLDSKSQSSDYPQAQSNSSGNYASSNSYGQPKSDPKPQQEEQIPVVDIDDDIPF